MSIATSSPLANPCCCTSKRTVWLALRIVPPAWGSHCLRGAKTREQVPHGPVNQDPKRVRACVPLGFLSPKVPLGFLSPKMPAQTFLAVCVFVWQGQDSMVGVGAGNPGNSLQLGAGMNIGVEREIHYCSRTYPCVHTKHRLATCGTVPQRQATGLFAVRTRVTLSEPVQDPKP